MISGDSIQLKLERLLGKQKRKNINEYIQTYKACIVSFGEGTVVYSWDQSDRFYNELQEQFEFTLYGRVNADVHVFEELSINAFLDTITKKETCIVLWSHGRNPVIQVNLKAALNNLDSLLVLSPDVWLLREYEFVIECSHDGVIRKIYRERQ